MGSLNLSYSHDSDKWPEERIAMGCVGRAHCLDRAARDKKDPERCHWHGRLQCYWQLIFLITMPGA